MASSRKPGSLGAEGVVPNIEDGTLARAVSPTPGPVGLHGEVFLTGPHLKPNRVGGSYKGLPVLRKGAHGKHVRWLQVLLNQHKAAQPALKEDGYFGPKTAAAVMNFQRSKSLAPDGVVGMQTWLKLQVSEESSQPSTPLKSSAAKSRAAAAVADWSLRRRFEEVLRLAPNHMAPQLAAQFRALITPLNVSIIAGTLAAWAVSHAFGAGEAADIVFLIVGAFFLGMAAFRVVEDLGECVMITVDAETEADLDRAADYLAEAVAILGVAAFLALVAKIGAKFGRGPGAGKGAAAAEEQGANLSREPRPGPREEPAPKPTTDPIAQRRAANQALRKSPQFQKDLAEARVNERQLEWMNNKEAPLGFDNPQQFQSFKQELSQALAKDGLNDAQVGMKGTATTFYSENPGKPLGHFWDADPTHPGDYDLNLSSAKMAQQMDEAGIGVSPKYGIFRTADINSQFPAVSDFSAKWSEILGRDVNVVGYPAGPPPVRDPTEFILVK